MLIESVRIQSEHVVLKDVDGSEVTLTASDALTLSDWLYEHTIELFTIEDSAQVEPRIVEQGE